MSETITDRRPSIAELQRLVNETTSSAAMKLRESAPAVLEVVAAALSLESQLDYFVGPRSDRLRAALAKVRL